MDMYKFSINKKYIVSTIRKSFINEMVEVIGIITYEEAKNTGFNVQILALNEKVVTDYTDTNNVVDYPSYFAAVEFYKCKRINSSKSEIIILWSEIIDSSVTSILSETYSYKALLKLNDIVTSGTTIYTENYIIDQLIKKAKDLGSTLSFKIQAGDTNSAVDVLQNRIKDCENILRSLQSLSVITPIIDRLNSGNISAKIDDIISQIGIINDKLTTISIGLS